jgi:hypothetical protein
VATPFVIGRHTHRRVPQAARPPAPSTGVDYLGLVAAAHDAEVVGQIDYAQAPLIDPDAEDER